MKTPFGLFALLFACLIQLSEGLAEDKKKDKVAEFQKQQLEAQQKLQQWKLQQMQQQQQQQRGRPPQQPQQAVVPQQLPPGGQNIAVQMAVHNYTGAPVILLWVAAPGQTQSFGTIKPTQPGDQPAIYDTFAGHTWQFFSGRKLIKTHTMGTQSVQQVVLGKPAVANQPVIPGAGIGNQPPAGGRPVGGFQAQPVVPPPVDVGVVLNNRPLVPQAPVAGGNAAIDRNDPAVAEFLRVHNQARAEVGVAPLKWSDKLARAAQQWADQMAATGNFAHNPQTPFGENIAGGSPPFSPAAGANSWLEEKAAFRPGLRDFSAVGHYTQMVWRGTTHVGFGTAQVNGMTVVVANYEPPGNIAGQPPF
jgi:pathogenesis-related protein 1